jgi:flagellar protein FlbD
MGGGIMVRLTRLSGVEVVVNADLIEFVEMTPDTLVTLVTGKKIPVRESADEIVERIVSYRRSIGVTGQVDTGKRIAAMGSLPSSGATPEPTGL